MASKRNYFGLEQHPLDKAKVAIVPVPFEKSTSYLKGTAHGPLAIINASEHLEFYDIETDSEPFLAGIHTTGEVTIQENENVSEFFNRLSKKIEYLLLQNKFLIVLGGEHSISPAIVKPFIKNSPNLSILHIDAHADLRDQYLGDQFSHACALRRIHDFTQKTVSVGIRSMSVEEAEYIKSAAPVIFYDWQIQNSGLPIDEILSHLTDEVYVTFDLDGLNPSEMPSVGTPEPGGLSYSQIMQLFEKLFEQKKVLGMDLVELKPDKINFHSDFLAAKIVYKAIALKFFK